MPALTILDEKTNIFAGLAFSNNLGLASYVGYEIVNSLFDVAVQNTIPICAEHDTNKLLGELLSYEYGSALITMKNGEKIIHNGYLVTCKAFDSDTIQKIKSGHYTGMSTSFNKGIIDEISLTTQPAYASVYVSEEDFVRFFVLPTITKGVKA